MSGGIRTSVKGYLIAQRLNLATQPLSENETISNNVTATQDPPLHLVEETTVESATYGLGMCDGSIPCFPIFGSATKNLASSPQPEGEILHSFNLRKFSYDELQAATRCFDSSNVVGRGGFGDIFKGWTGEHSFRSGNSGNSPTIAIRMLQPATSMRDQEWYEKFNILGKLSHPNLAKLIGYCISYINTRDFINKTDFNGTRFLVYEFMPKGSLEHHLFGSKLQTAHYGARTSRFELLSWNLRMKIALGAAKGLAYLHSDKANVIFVDFQTSKVLFDTNYNVKLCGYALDKERLGPYIKQQIHVDEVCQYEDEQRRDAYTAPEYKYFGTGSLTSKSDVYSFGVILLELLSSRRAFHKNQTWISSHDSALLRDAYAELSSEDKVSVMIDTCLDGQYSLGRAVKALDLAIQCISKEPALRPDMNQVIEILEELVSSGK